MFKKCPKCDLELAESELPCCPRCNFDLSQWAGSGANNKAEATCHTRSAIDFSFDVGGSPDSTNNKGFLQFIRNVVFPPPPQFNSIIFLSCLALELILMVWGVSFFGNSIQDNDAGNSFLHNIHLVFHEAGHVIFRPLGNFMTVCGGSLMQLIVPLVACGSFLFSKRDAFAASVCLWWLGCSFIDLAPYIGDARALELMLLGGGTGRDMPGMHDWEYILGELGLLQSDLFLAGFSHKFGVFIILLSFCWGIHALYLQWKDR